MSLKKCPKCNKEVGPRTKICPKCSHDFAQPPFSSSGKTPRIHFSSVSTPKTKKRTSTKNKPNDLTIGDGGWVQDIEKGMPKIAYPSRPCKNMSVEDVKEQVEYHGLGFCLYNYIYPENIKDKKLVKMWKNTAEQMREIVRYLYGENK
jgi:hypothetical protein